MSVPESKFTQVFAPGNNVFIGQLFRAHVHMPFHLSVWKAINDPTNIKSNVFEFALPASDRHNSGDRMQVLMFSKESDFKEYQAWWANYITRFGDKNIDECTYPSIHDGMRVDGYAYKHGISGSHDTKRGFHDWCWIVGHTTGTVTYTNEYWIFEDKAEMLQLKLRGTPEFSRYFNYLEVLSGADVKSYADIDQILPVHEDDEDGNEWNDYDH